MSVSKDKLNTAEHLLHYQLGACLGEGGFGQVYQAWDTKLHRQVAIKYLKTAIPGVNLLKEARMAASLQHTAFVKIHALEQQADSCAIVMELVPGKTVRQLTEQQSLKIAQSLDIVCQVAQAMHEAHAAGLMHGDLKPSNLMVEPSGAVRILDFGLAAQSDRDATTSLVQADPQGTIAYMAPEVLTGSSLTPSSDIYALGVILYELLVGSRPFSQLSGLALAAALIQSSSDQWPWPDYLPLTLRHLVRAMTARQLDQRLTSMHEVATQCAQLASLDSDALSVASIDLTALNLASRKKRNQISIQADWGQVFQISRRRLVFLLLLVVGFGAWYSQPYWPKLRANFKTYSESQEMASGQQALSQYDRSDMLEIADQHFTKVLSHSPSHAAAMANMSLVLSYRYAKDDLDVNLLKQAEERAKKALAANEFLALAHVASAKVFGLQEQFESAFAAINRALALDPNSQVAWQVKGELLLAARHLEDLAEFSKQASQRFAKQRAFADQLARGYELQSSFKAAEAMYRASIEMQDSAVDAYVGLARVCVASNRVEDAISALKLGLKRKLSGELFEALGDTYFGQGNYVDAAQAFESAVGFNTNSANHFRTWEKLADTLSWIPGRTESVKKAYEQALSLASQQQLVNPNSADLLSRLGLYSVKLGQKNVAQDYANKALAFEANNAEIQFRVGVIFEMLGNRVNALAAIETAKKLGYSIKKIEAEPELISLRRDPVYLKQ